MQDEIENKGYVKIDRTDHIDTLVSLVRKNLITFSGYIDQKQVIIDHLKDMVREEEPEKKATWKKLNGNDHYFHALAFLSSAVKLHTGNFMGYQEKELRSNLLILPTTMPNHITKDIYGRVKTNAYSH